MNIRAIYYSAMACLCLSLSGCIRDRTPSGLQRSINAEIDLMAINQDAAAPYYRLTLEEIIAIAVENNYDLLVKAKEFDVQRQFAIRDQLKMLPQLLLNGEESNRNNDLIVASRSVVPNVPPAPPSISTQRHVSRHDITLVFNLLDFGLSYYKARQEEKKGFILALEYEKARQALVLDIHKQYWKAVVSKTAMQDSEFLMEKSQELRSKIGSQINERVLSKTKGLKSCAELQNINIEFTGYDNDYYKAISELIVLMGLPPNATLEIVYDDSRPVNQETEDICKLESMALMRRPELYIKDTEQKISEEEVRYAFLQMLPGIEWFAGNYYDANKYFAFHHWIVAGARATWNLFNIPSQFIDGTGNAKRKDLIKTQRIALSVGVLSQVRLAHILYQENLNQYQLAHTFEEINHSLLLATQMDTQEGISSETDLVIVAAQALLSKVNAIKAYGEAQIALAQLNYSIGVPEYYKSASSSPLSMQ